MDGKELKVTPAYIKWIKSASEEETNEEMARLLGVTVANLTSVPDEAWIDLAERMQKAWDQCIAEHGPQ